MPLVAPTQKLLKTRNAAIYLNVSQWRIRQMAHKGQIPYVQFEVDGTLYFDISDLDALIQRHKEGVQ